MSTGECSLFPFKVNFTDIQWCRAVKHAKRGNVPLASMGQSTFCPKCIPV